jgi:DNA uptake protein ComE-like DNA-binding protein
VQDSVKLDSLLRIMGDPVYELDHEEIVSGIVKDTIFFFDPNIVSFDEMIMLQMDTLIAKRIVKYRNKNGRFYQKADLKKIYDFPDELYVKLENYISLSSGNQVRKNEMSIRKKKKAVPGYVSERIKLDLNEMDTSDLKLVKGIGDVFSSRIIKYKELLGGYVNIRQLDDVYGLKGISLQNLKEAVFIDTLFIPRKVRINFADWKELVRHPYIDKTLANHIIEIRTKNGFLENVDDLSYLPEEFDSLLIHIEPYLEF